MAERTPKPNTVRAGWAKGHPFPLATEVEERYAEFDRMLAKVRAEAWDEGWVSAMQYEGRCQDAEAAGQGVLITKPKNPYRAEAARLREGAGRD